MITVFSRYLASHLGRMNNEPSSDLEIYVYGFEILLSTIFNMASIFIFSFILGVFIETVLFTLGFATLRLSAGGYHASSHFKCLFQYGAICFISILSVNYIERMIGINFILLIVLNMISLYLIYRYAPIDTVNKPLSPGEYRKHRKNSRLTIIILFSLMIVSYFALNISIYHITILAIALFSESLTLIFPKQKGGDINEYPANL